MRSEGMRCSSLRRSLPSLSEFSASLSSMSTCNTGCQQSWSCLLQKAAPCDSEGICMPQLQAYHGANMVPANGLKARGRIMLQASSPLPPTGSAVADAAHLKCCHSHLGSDRIAAVGAAMLATADGEHDLQAVQQGSCGAAHSRQGAGSALRPTVCPRCEWRCRLVGNAPEAEQL